MVLKTHLCTVFFEHYFDLCMILDIVITNKQMWGKLGNSRKEDLCSGYLKKIGSEHLFMKCIENTLTLTVLEIPLLITMDSVTKSITQNVIKSVSNIVLQKTRQK